MNKQNVKVTAATSIFWILVAGVIVLVQQTAKTNYERGLSDGYSKAVHLQAK